AERNRLVDQAVDVISKDQSVLLYSAMGPDDPKIVSTKEQIKAFGLPAGSVGEILATQQGLILRDILEKTGLRRVAVAGGDTCGYVLKQLGVYVLEFVIPLGTAAPLCRASSNIPQFDGIEIALKGGQLGEVDFFGSVLRGKQD
ncbi:MAG: nucleotide-binding domain containing protein, partial [Syntrophothermus sp.]